MSFSCVQFLYYGVPTILNLALGFKSSGVGNLLVLFSFLCNRESNLFFFIHGWVIDYLDCNFIESIMELVVTAFCLDRTLTLVTRFQNMILPPAHLFLLMLLLLWLLLFLFSLLFKLFLLLFILWCKKIVVLLDSMYRRIRLFSLMKQFLRRYSIILNCSDFEIWLIFSLSL